MVYYVGLFAFLFLFTNPFFMVIVYAGAVSLAFFYCGAQRLLSALRFLLPLGAVVMALNPILVRRGSTILFYLLDNPVTLEAVYYGAYNALLLTGTILVFMSFNSVVTSERFLYVFAKALPRTAFVADMSLRFIPHFRNRASELMHVQQTKGIAIEKGNIRRSLKNGGTLLNALLMWNLEEGLETGLALRAKDYGGRRRTSYDPYVFAKRDAAWLCFILASGFGCAASHLTGAGKHLAYPKLAAPEILPWGVFFMALLAVYVSVPFIMEAFYGINTVR